MRKALGRGLNALFPDSSAGAAHAAAAVSAVPTPGDVRGSGEDIGVAARSVPIELIRPNGTQPRQEINPEELRDLTESVRAHGVIQPLLVRSAGDGFELIAGERRWRAARMAGLASVPVIVREASDGESFELALIENIQRSDLTPLEEAAAYARLTEEYGLTQEKVSERVGKSRATVANMLRLLGLPDEVKAQVASGALTMGHARAILAAPGATRQIALAREIVARGLPVRTAEHLASAQVHASRREPRDSIPVDVHVRAVEDELCGILGTKVRLVSRGAAGSIEIRYHSPDERDRLIERLRACGSA